MVRAAAWARQIAPAVTRRDRTLLRLALGLVVAAVTASAGVSQQPTERRPTATDQRSGNAGEPVPGAGAVQQATGTVQGVVSAWGGQPLPFATVTLDSTGRTVFGDSSGTFRLDGVPVGRHRLWVRDLGFVPAAVTVDVRTDEAAPLRVDLVRLPYRLPPVSVRGQTRCRTPGIPDSTVNPELAVLARELRANGDRVALLLGQQPFDYTIEAHIDVRHEWASALESEEVDTLVYASGERHPYRPGRVLDQHFVGRRVHGGYPGPYIYLPDLEDLTDSLFQTHHCFSYAGEDTADGRHELRIDFRPLDSMHGVDVAGAFFLDPDRLVVLRSVTRLTHPDRMYPPIRALTAEVRYREIVPLVAVEDSAHIVQVSGSALDGGPRETVEDHRLIALRARPTRPKR